MAEPIQASSGELIREIEALRAHLAEAENRLAEAQDVIRAIQSGDVDAVVVSGPQGEQVFTLQGAEYAYRALVEAMNEGAATLGLDGTVLYCNQRLSDLLAISLEQIIGHPVAKLFAAEAALEFETLLARAQAGEPCRAELDFKSGQGNRIPTYVSLREMKSVDPSALCLVVTDLTERKQRDELIASGSLAASILESAAEAIAVCDQAGKIFRVNQALIDLCGANPLFQNFEAALPLEIDRELDGRCKPFFISKALGGATLRAQEVRLVRNNGQTVPLLLTAAPIHSATGILGCVLTMTDITDRKKAEGALIRSDKLASVGRMASTIAHEINNPLETIGNVIYLAMTDPGISPSAKSFLEVAVQELDRVNHIARQTLAFHRETSAPALIDLRASIDTTLKLFAGRLEARNITVARRYAEVGRIRAFGGEIQQVISNLLANSMDAMPNHGRIEIRLSRTLSSGTEKVRLAIADTGSGISPERLASVFEPFFTTKEMHGTGLGLWVTKQIVEKHRATIRVRSKLGRGTVFSIVFPLAEVAKES